MEHYPCKGECIYDTLFNKEGIYGTIKGIIYVNDELFVEVLWDNKENLEQVEYDVFFTQNNCGNGRWDNQHKMWFIEPTGDELPEDHPFCISFKKSIEELNIKLVKERLGSDANLDVASLLLKSCEYRKEADDMGKKNAYYNWYFGKSEDYARMAQYKQEQQENKQ